MFDNILEKQIFPIKFYGSTNRPADKILYEIDLQWSEKSSQKIAFYLSPHPYEKTYRQTD